jgi:type IV pilus assembly protein PilF
MELQMFQWKRCAVIFIVSLLISCSSNPMNEGEQEKEKDKDKGQEKESLSLYDLPETLDLEKAARLNIELGIGYLNKGQVPRAKTKFMRAMQLGPQLPETHYAYGYFQERTGDLLSAEKSYLKAITLSPKTGNAHNNYGAFLCRQAKYRQAEKEFLKAVADPSYLSTAEALENAGLCVLQIPDQQKAVEYFERTLRYDQNRPHALLELALIYYREKRYDEARENLMRFSQIADPTARSLLLNIELAKESGDQDKVASYELLLRSRFPNAKLSDLLHVAMVDLMTAPSLG